MKGIGKKGDCRSQYPVLFYSPTATAKYYLINSVDLIYISRYIGISWYSVKYISRYWNRDITQACGYSPAAPVSTNNLKLLR